ncbi:MAG: DUF4140 domain-containing protein, partial [Bacteroidales bacterium]|nr:DUF4140 domain-containing protein [Bacteroidales bacterium]
MIKSLLQTSVFLLIACNAFSSNEEQKNCDKQKCDEERKNNEKSKHESDIISPTTLTDFSLRSSLAKEEYIVSTERFVSEDLSDKNKTKICLYLDGATVNVLLQNREVYSSKSKNFVIHNLSNFVDKKSIFVRGPSAITILSYKMNQDNSSKARFLELNVKNPYKITDIDNWQIQYVVRNVHWAANHLIELSQNMENVSFVTSFNVKNSSGINFKNAQIQFLDDNLPSDELDTDKENVVTKTCATSYTVYKYGDDVDIISEQNKTILWANAKKVAITSSNGLFVGGPFLKKMTGPAYPQIENWINFPNTENVGLGKHLPSGKVAIYHNRDGFASLIGFSSIKQV